jgi:Rieske Fe-S protein
LSDERTDRRGTLKVLAVVGGAAACGAIAVPGAAMIASAAKTAGDGAARWLRAMRLDALEEGVPKRVAMIADARDAWTIERSKELGAVWLVRRGDAVECFSATCPHLGCTIGHDDTSGFFCPCHESAFAPDGTRITGPSPRGLDRLKTRVVDGSVEVDFHKYRQGTPERIEIG